MDNLEKMEKRWQELASKPKSKSEIEETLILAKNIELERAKEYDDLIDELSKIGIRIDSIWDLVNTKTKYTKALPILIKYLPRFKSDKNKEGIVRALTIKEAKGKVTDILIQEYNKTSKSKVNLRWVIGNAINKTISEDDIERILPIVKDKENGVSREMIVLALSQNKKSIEKVERTLIDLTYDDEVKLYAIEALTKLKSINARKRMEELSENSNLEISKRAKKFLKAIK